MDSFYEACSDRVKDRLSEFDRPDSLEAYMETAIKIDDRQFQRIQEKKYQGNSSTPPGIFRNQKINDLNPKTTTLRPFSTHINDPKPMQLDGAQRHQLSDSEKDRRRTNGLCMYCGDSGHIVKFCPLKSTNGPYKANLGTSESLNLDFQRSTPDPKLI
jgi:hypothetical protein